MFVCVTICKNEGFSGKGHVIVILYGTPVKIITVTLEALLAIE